MTETVLCVMVVLLVLALLGLMVLAARERGALTRQWASEREMLLRAAMAKDGHEFVDLQRSADMGAAIVERERARLQPPPEPRSQPPEGLG